MKTATTKKQKTYSYHTSHSFIVEGKKQTFATQLYEIGVYGIFNNDPAMQGSFTPNDIVKIEKSLNKAFEKKEITDLTFGMPITVKEIDGFWAKV